MQTNTGALPLCRFCKAPLKRSFVDLGMSPLCENFLESAQLNQMEAFYPLKVWLCEACLLVQLQEYVQPQEIFSHYAYFSSYSDSWLRHAERYAAMARERFQITPDHHVVEVASNDGYLLQYFAAAGIPVTGIEPAANVAVAAEEKGVPTEVCFFGRETAERLVGKGKGADLLIGNNVLAHVPDINDFVAGLRILLKPTGVLTMEFPHLLRLMQGNQFDTIYHEHFSYLSLAVVQRIFAAHGLRVFDVEELRSHGGSLRVFACHEEAQVHAKTAAVAALIAVEKEAHLDRVEGYGAFGPQVEKTKRELLRFLIEARSEGKRIAAYGAPGKGNTLLNYCGIRTDLLEFAVDRNPFKHGKFCPGTHIPIFPVAHLEAEKPDYVLILPWNLKEEIVAQMAGIRAWGGRFVAPIPQLEIID